MGRWNISNIEGWEPTPDDFASAVAALGCPAVRRPVLKLGHTGQPGAGDPAIGYIDNMATTGDGQVLVGDFAAVPAWLAAEDANGASVLSSAYPDRSGEWEHNYVCQLGHTHPFVLHAMALLGVVRPGIGTLQSLHDLYTHPPAQEVPPMPAASLPSADGLVQSAATADDVRKAYYAGPGTNFDLYIREMYVDPPELIVQDDADGTLTRVAYTVKGNGTVTFAEPQAVQVKYVAARAAASVPVIAFASHAEARPESTHTETETETVPDETTTTTTTTTTTDPPPDQGGGTGDAGDESPTDAPADREPDATPPAASAVGTATQGGAGMDPAKIREAVGLSADASDEDVKAALAAAGLVPSAPVPVAASAGHVTVPNADSGVTLVDASVISTLEERARRGEEAFAMLQRQRRDTVIDTAIHDGKFPVARREHYQAMWDADPDGTEAMVKGLARNMVPVSEAAGYAGRADEDRLDREYAALYPEAVSSRG